MSVSWCKFSGVVAGVELLENRILMDVLNRRAYSVRQARQSCFKGSLQRIIPGVFRVRVQSWLAPCIKDSFFLACQTSAVCS